MLKIHQAIWKKLKEVMDPEINISVVDLGLVYEVREKNGAVNIKMTLTTIGCPLFDLIEKDVKEKIRKIRGVREVSVELVFDPPWAKEMISKEARLQLGI